MNGIVSALSARTALRHLIQLTLAMDPIRMSIAKPAMAKNGDLMVMVLVVVVVFCKPMDRGGFSLILQHFPTLMN